MNKIILQKQPTPQTCTHASLAMVAGVTVEDVIEKVGPQPLGHELLEELFNFYHLKHEYIHGYSIDVGSVYIVDVPSLQTKATLHKIVLDLRGTDAPVLVYDPMLSQGEAYTIEMLTNGVLPFGNAIKVWKELPKYVN